MISTNQKSNGSQTINMPLNNCLTLHKCIIRLTLTTSNGLAAKVPTKEAIEDDL